MHLRRHISYANVVATLALFIALGTGGAYAATKLAPNSVGSREIRNGSVKSADLAPTARVSKSNSVFRAAVTDTILDPNTQAVVNALAGAVRGEKGDTGATGPAGPTGAPGAAGTPGVSGYVIREAYSRTVGPGNDVGVEAKCLDDEHAISGGGLFEAAGTSGAIPTASYPALAGGVAEGWAVTYSNGGSAPAGRVHAFVVCARTF